MRREPASSQPEEAVLSNADTWIWLYPLAVSSLAAVSVSILAILPSLLTAQTILHPALSLLPALVASSLTLASCREQESHHLRNLAALLLNLAAGLLGAFYGGMGGGLTHWRLASVESACAFWVVQGWLLWLVGELLARRDPENVWSGVLATNSLAAGGWAAVAPTVAAALSPPPSSLLPISSIMAGAFLLAIAQFWRRGDSSAIALSAGVVLLSTGAHAASASPAASYAETTGTLFSLLAVGTYFLLARKHANHSIVYLTLGPLLLGFGLFLVWKQEFRPGAYGPGALQQTLLNDRLLANGLWLFGGIASAGLYLKAAKRFVHPRFAYLSAVAFTGVWCHAIESLLKPQVEWFAVALLPCLGALYGYGMMQSGKEAGIRDPFRNVALFVSTFLATLLTVRAANGAVQGSSPSLIAVAIVLSCVFALIIVEAHRTGARAPLVVSLALIGMAGICFQSYVSYHTPFVATVWVLFSLLAAASYFTIGWRHERYSLTGLALWPLLLGYFVLAAWKYGALLAIVDVHFADNLVIVGGLAAATAYFQTARHLKASTFSYLAALFLIGTYCHTLTLFSHLTPEWFLLALIPAPIMLYFIGGKAGEDQAYLADPLRHIGAAVAFLCLMILSGRAMFGVVPSGDRLYLLPITMVSITALAAMSAEAHRTGHLTPRILSYTVPALAGILFHWHVTHPSPWHMTAWTVLMLIAAAGSFVSTRGEEKPLNIYAPLWPLSLGYSLFVAWKGLPLLAAFDVRTADLAWIAGGVGAALLYVGAARRSQSEPCAYLAALLFIASYTHLLSILAPYERHTERYALLVLPLLAALYGFGVTRAAEESLGLPFRRVALICSGLAILWSMLAGDGFVALFPHVMDHNLITFTLAAYGVAYGAIALFRRTPGTIAVSSVTITAAYLHGLLTLAPCWTPSPLLSWPRFALLAILAGVVWNLFAWLLEARLQQPMHARPLQSLTAVLTFIFSGIALFSYQTPGEGDWSLLALMCAGGIWLSLWKQQAAEVCWHLGAWSLLAAWCVLISLHLHATLDRLDLFALPFGLYLLLIGHRSANQDHLNSARLAWWPGLLAILAPTFLLYWTHAAAAYHVPLLIGECVLATLFGVVQRIRAYVSAGFAFLVLLTVASWFRYVNDVAGTLSALAIGVGLFIAGFYALTHRQRIDAWLGRVSGVWRAWRAWR